MKNVKESLSTYFLQYKTNKKLWLYFAVELLLSGIYLAFDLLTKEFIYGTIKRTGNDMVIWDGVVRFTAVENTGGSFGAFSGNVGILAAISIIASVALIFVIFITLPERNGWLRASFLLMLAGGIGNLVDRLAFGFVRDFFYFELIDFAVFNFADSGLVIGSILLIIYVLFYYDKKKKKAETDAVEPTPIEPIVISKETESEAEKPEVESQEDGAENL